MMTVNLVPGSCAASIMKRLGLLMVGLVCWVPGSRVLAEAVYSGLRDIAIPTNFNGTFIDLN